MSKGAGMNREIAHAKTKLVAGAAAIWLLALGALTAGCASSAPETAPRPQRAQQATPQCAEGLEALEGGCCFAGQAWSPGESQCVGLPRCDSAKACLALGKEHSKGSARAEKDVRMGGMLMARAASFYTQECDQGQAAELL